MADAGESGWNKTHSFLDKDEVSLVHLTDIDEARTQLPARGFRKEDLFFDFSGYRPLERAELSPDLSTSILDSYGMDPYEESPRTESKMLVTVDGDQFLRVADGDYSVYFSIDGAELPREPSYLETYEPWWRS
ncbi:hypothetical protein GKQ38_03145 [Candidatus Nanohaloarchaea archaeon]|nr:hypothetical protein GKQ38_03145 [Candidatus Nanohaloarchaea archaeon]